MPAKRPALPKLVLFNRQKSQPVPLPWLRRIAKNALPACLAAAKTREDSVLADLPEVEITYVSDAEIARVHGEFLDDATPTDVITFHHGEILISAETAARQALDHGQTLDHELALYLVHGLLHLAGWHDEDDQEAAEMARTQEAILQQAASALTASR
jgi:probable rRNA maturation factor